MSKRGKCMGCGEYVRVDVPPDGHTRAEHDSHDVAVECSNCPVPILCGPVVIDGGADWMSPLSPQGEAPAREPEPADERGEA